MNCTLDPIKAQSTVHPPSVTTGALTVNDVIECDVIRRGQRAGHELPSWTRDRWCHTHTWTQTLTERLGRPLVVASEIFIWGEGLWPRGLEDRSSPVASRGEWVRVYGLTCHSTHRGSFRRRVFPGNQLHWYWQPNNNKDEIHKTEKHTQKPKPKTVYLYKNCSYQCAYDCVTRYTTEQFW